MKKRTKNKEQKEDEDTETPNLDKSKVTEVPAEEKDKEKDVDLKTKFSELEKKYTEQGEKLDKALEFISKLEKSPEKKEEPTKVETKPETKQDNPDYIKRSDLDKLLEERDRAALKKMVIASLTPEQKKVLETFPKWENLDGEQIQVVIGTAKPQTNKVTFPNAQSEAISDAQPLTVGQAQSNWEKWKKENGL